MLYTIIDSAVKQAKNDNYYVEMMCEPEDAFSEDLKYALFGTQDWCDKLQSKIESGKIKVIELDHRRITVAAYNRVDNGVIDPKVCSTVSVVVRQHKGKDVENAEALAAARRSKMLRDGLICEVSEDPLAGATGEVIDQPF